MGYQFIVENVEIEYLTNSWEYDTQSPANWCTSALKKINEHLEQGSQVTIIQKDEKLEKQKIYIIKNQEELKDWLKNVFKGFENIFDV